MFRACISRRSITGRHYNIGLRINFRVHALRGWRKKDLIHLTCFYSNTGSRSIRAPDNDLYIIIGKFYTVINFRILKFIIDAIEYYGYTFRRRL